MREIDGPVVDLNPLLPHQSKDTAREEITRERPALGEFGVILASKALDQALRSR